MKLFAKYILASVLVLGAVAPAVAQDNGSSSSTVMRRRGDTDRARRGQQEQSQPGVTPRMQQRLAGESNVSDADRQWMRVIYRDLEVKNPKNASLYFPEDVVDGQENLFRIIMRLLAEGRIPAYEYLDGKEIFTDQYRLKVGDMLDRFHVMYTPAKGSTEKAPKYTIEEADVPSNEVLSICPVLHRTDDFGGEAVRYPMFWVKMTDLRPYLAQQYIFIDDDNNLPKYTYADFFNMAMYDGDIYKTRNLTNKSMMQLFPDPDDRKRAQDSIQERLDNFDKKLWVPSREEVIAAREAREAAEEAAEAAKAEAEAIPSRDGDSGEGVEEAAAETKKSVRSSRSRRSSAAKKENAKKETKKKQPKASKPKAAKSSSSSAVRSVRRRK